MFCTISIKRSEKPADTITLYVYTGKDAAFTLYEDENTNYNYEKGAFINITFKYNEATKQLTIADRKGSFPGMLNNRTFRVVTVSRDKAQTLDFDVRPVQTISYSGKAVTVVLK